MNYIERELEGKFLEASGSFRAVMVTGARQVGKSTMLKHLAQNQGRTVVTMDNTADRELARRDPALFSDLSAAHPYRRDSESPRIVRADKDHERRKQRVRPLLASDNGIHDTEGFRRFLRACAALTGELINYSNLARAADVSVATAKEWTSILIGMGVIYLLEPFSNNALKRLVKAPKLYFCDTGLAANLSMWPSADVLMAGAANGHFYETHVLMELVRAYAYGKAQVNLTFYRDRDGCEIDLIIEKGRTLHPIEVKKMASPTPADTRRFKLLEASGLERGPGGIVCMGEKPYPLTEMDSIIPSNIL